MGSGACLKQRDFAMLPPQEVLEKVGTRMLQFRQVQDKSSKSFVFERIFPNASSNDYLNEGMGRRNPQQSIDRAFFYVFASKIGTVLDEANVPCVAGNYMPAWVGTVGIDTYRVQGRWPEALWKHYKLEDHMYEQYLYLARDGVQARKRNLDACKAWKEAAGEQEEIDRVVKRIRGNASFQSCNFLGSHTTG